MKNVKNWNQFNEGFMGFFKDKDEDEIVKNMIDNINEIEITDYYRHQHVIKSNRIHFDFKNKSFMIMRDIIDPYSYILKTKEQLKIESKYNKKLYNLLDKMTKNIDKDRKRRQISDLKSEMDM